MKRSRCVVWRFLLLGIGFTLASCDAARPGPTQPDLRPSADADADPRLEPLVPDDSAVIRARAGAWDPGESVLMAVSGIPIKTGQIAAFSVSVENGRCEDVTVSGVFSEVLWTHIGTPTACTGSRDPVTLGPAERDGELYFSLPLTNHRVQITPMDGGWQVAFDDDPFGNGGDGDFNDIIIFVELPEVRSGYIECTPSVQRGNEVRCEMAPGVGYTVIRRRARGQGFDIDEYPNTSHRNVHKYIWRGPAVANTRVDITIEYSEGERKRQRTYSTRFRVTPREWPELQLQAPQTVVGLRGAMRPYPTNGLLGTSAPAVAGLTFATLRTETVTDGPNAGLSFIRDPLPEIPYLIYIHPGLYGAPPPGAQQWYADQNGSGSGTCTASVFAILLPEILRHEGVTQEDESHYGITRTFYRVREPHLEMEAVYQQGDATSVRIRAAQRWVELHESGWHRARQDAFDNADLPRIAQRLGCTLDLNPNDN